MPHIIPNGSDFLLLPEKEAKLYLNNLAENLALLR